MVLVCRAAGGYQPTTPRTNEQHVLQFPSSLNTLHTLDEYSVSLAQVGS
jgi:hypothetical protein